MLCLLQFLNVSPIDWLQRVYGDYIRYLGEGEWVTLRLIISIDCLLRYNQLLSFILFLWDILILFYFLMSRSLDSHFIIPYRTMS